MTGPPETREFIKRKETNRSPSIPAAKPPFKPPGVFRGIKESESSHGRSRSKSKERKPKRDDIEEEEPLPPIDEVLASDLRYGIFNLDDPTEENIGNVLALRMAPLILTASVSDAQRRVAAVALQSAGFLPVRSGAVSLTDDQIKKLFPNEEPDEAILKFSGGCWAALVMHPEYDDIQPVWTEAVSGEEQGLVTLLEDTENEKIWTNTENTELKLFMRVVFPDVFTTIFEEDGPGVITTEQAPLIDILQPFAVTVFNPSLVAADGHVNQLLQRAEDAGLVVIRRLRRQVQPIEARRLYLGTVHDSIVIERLQEQHASGESEMAVLSSNDPDINVAETWVRLVRHVHSCLIFNLLQRESVLEDGIWASDRPIMQLRAMEMFFAGYLEFLQEPFHVKLAARVLQAVESQGADVINPTDYALTKGEARALHRGTLLQSDTLDNIAQYLVASPNHVVTLTCTADGRIVQARCMEVKLPAPIVEEKEPEKKKSVDQDLLNKQLVLVPAEQGQELVEFLAEQNVRVVKHITRNMSVEDWRKMVDVLRNGPSDVCSALMLDDVSDTDVETRPHELLARIYYEENISEEALAYLGEVSCVLVSAAESNVAGLLDNVGLLYVTPQSAEGIDVVSCFFQ